MDYWHKKTRPFAREMDSRFLIQKKYDIGRERCNCNTLPPQYNAFCGGASLPAGMREKYVSHKSTKLLCGTPDRKKNT